MWKNITLKRDGKLLTNDKETELFLGVLFSFTQAPKKGGIVRTFDVFIDGIFPAPDLGKFVFKHWRFKEFLLLGIFYPI